MRETGGKRSGVGPSSPPAGGETAGKQREARFGHTGVQEQKEEKKGEKRDQEDLIGANESLDSSTEETGKQSKRFGGGSRVGSPGDGSRVSSRCR